KKLPAKVEQQTLSRGHRGQSLRRGNAGIGRQQCVSAANGAREQRGGGECKAGAKQIATSERKTGRIHPVPHGEKRDSTHWSICKSAMTLHLGLCIISPQIE